MAVKAERRVNSMRKYPKQFYDHLSHAGKKGMKWGYNDGEPNGKRTALAWDEYEYEGEIYKKTEGNTMGDRTMYYDKDGNPHYNKYNKNKVGSSTSKIYTHKKNSKGKTKYIYEHSIGKADQAINKGRRWFDDLFK